MEWMPLSDWEQKGWNRGGAERDRTDDLLSAIQALSQLSYSPTLLFREGIAANCLPRGEIPGERGL